MEEVVSADGHHQSDVSYLSTMSTSANDGSPMGDYSAEGREAVKVGNSRQLRMHATYGKDHNRYFNSYKLTETDFLFDQREAQASCNARLMYFTKVFNKMENKQKDLIQSIHKRLVPFGYGLIPSSGYYMYKSKKSILHEWELPILKSII